MSTAARWSKKDRGSSWLRSDKWSNQWSGLFYPDPFRRPRCRSDCCCTMTRATPNPLLGILNVEKTIHVSNLFSLIDEVKTGNKWTFQLAINQNGSLGSNFLVDCVSNRVIILLSVVSFVFVVDRLDDRNPRWVSFCPLYFWFDFLFNLIQLRLFLVDDNFPSWMYIQPRL